MKISHKLTNLREAKGFSKNKLAKLSGVSQSYISDLEADKKNATIEVLNRICVALDTTIVEFLSESTSDQRLSPDLIQLLETAKTLTPEQRRQVTKMIQVLKQ